MGVLKRKESLKTYGYNNDGVETHSSEIQVSLPHACNGELDAFNACMQATRRLSRFLLLQFLDRDRRSGRPRVLSIHRRGHEQVS